MATRDALGAVLTESAPEVQTGEAERLARKHFGVDSVASPLSGERDRNFYLRDAGGIEWVLKVVHPAEDPDLTDLHSRVLLHLASVDAGLPVPRVRLPLHGDRADVLWHRPTGTDARPCRVRMYSYLAGYPMHLSSQSPALRHRLGALLARLDIALSGLSHPAAAHDLAWNAHKPGRVRHLLKDSDDASALTAALDHFEDHTERALAGARRQIVHNDFNPHNILTRTVDDPEITGIIDFGDLVRAPLVQDLATAAAYQIGESGHPLAGPAAVATAYHALCPLAQVDVEVLFDLIVARLVLSVAISDWHARQHPANQVYIMRNTARARQSLRRLESWGCEDARAYFQAALRTSRGAS